MRRTFLLLHVFSTFVKIKIKAILGSEHFVVIGFCSFISQRKALSPDRSGMCDNRNWERRMRSGEQMGGGREMSAA